MKPFEAGVVAAGAAYLVALGWAMQHLSYDVWGALVIVPVLTAISAPLINRTFTGDVEHLRPWIWGGLVVKFAGAIAGYYVRFDAYGGSADAGRYHSFGKVLAEDVRSGLATPFALIPRATGTQFVETLTGAVYTIIGSSLMGGFMVFTWMSFWGLVFYVKAAHLAIGGLATRRYALAVLLFPSLIYWGSSIGKEAVVGLCLGLTAWGAAIVFTRRGNVRLGVVMIVVGLLGSGFVRPHFASVWAGAIVIALLVRVVLDVSGRRTRDDERRRLQLSTVLLVGVAGIGFLIVASVALNYLPSDAGDTAPVSDQFTGIFDTVEDRTTQGGSSFTPATVSGPQDWPWAAFRTVTRPLINEADSLATLLPAVEMTALLLVGVFSWRRLLHVPKLMLTVPYLVFAALCVVTFGVAFSSIGNLGILVRQRSLILPLLLVFWCVPPIVFASERRTTARARRPRRGRRPRPRDATLPLSADPPHRPTPPPKISSVAVSDSGTGTLENRRTGRDGHLRRAAGISCGDDRPRRSSARRVRAG